MTDLLLEWESVDPLQVNRFILPLYELSDTVTVSATSCYPESTPSPRHRWMRTGGGGAAGSRRRPRDYDQGNYVDDATECLTEGAGSE